MVYRRTRKTARLLAGVVLVLLPLFCSVGVSFGVESVPLEFLFYPPCACDPENYDIYVHNSQVVADVEESYGQSVVVDRIPFYSEEGSAIAELHGIGIEDWNTIIVNHERVYTGSVNETRLLEIIDAYLTDSVYDVAVGRASISNPTVESGESVNITVTVRNNGVEDASFDISVYSNESLIGVQPVENLGPDHELSTTFVWDTHNAPYGSYRIRAEAAALPNETKLVNNEYVVGEVEVTAAKSLALIFLLAFSLGFFETFSPCLMVLLSFALSYTIGKESRFLEGFSKVMSFGAGFLAATLLLAVVFGLAFLSAPSLQRLLTWIVCIFAIIFGLNLLGVKVIPSRFDLQSKPLIKKLAAKRAATYGGLFFIGFVFYFLDPCIAPIFVSMAPLLIPELLIITIAVFCLGALIPFLVIGVFAASISKLVRSTHRHRVKIRGASGLILLSYAVYLIIFYLLPI